MSKKGYSFEINAEEKYYAYNYSIMLVCYSRANAL